ncbi:MAG: BMC domain-containing protein [Leptolinea sp.]|nr:BMC domain-containing protein [Leptolinea sp.]
MQLRTYLLIDQMQPQYGALTGKTMQGEIPVEGMAEIYIETAPASDIYRVMDIALKTMDVRAGALAVEREYGSLEIHSRHQEVVKVAGQQALEVLGLTENDRLKPEILSSLLISNVDPFQAQLINKTAFGGLLLAGQTLCVLEVMPAAYIVLAANEAEKAANITLVNYTPRGRSGRLYFSGSDAEVRQARDAAIKAIEALPGRTK